MSSLTIPGSPPAAAGSGASLTYVGTSASPVSDAGQARPSTDGPVYWLCANGVTPTNALDGDIIFNADA